MTGDAIDSMIDASIAAKPTLMCYFPGDPPFQAELPKPIPREHEVDGVRYELDYEGSFCAGYRLA